MTVIVIVIIIIIIILLLYRGIYKGESGDSLGDCRVGRVDDALRGVRGCVVIAGVELLVFDLCCKFNKMTFLSQNVLPDILREGSMS